MSEIQTCDGYPTKTLGTTTLPKTTSNKTNINQSSWCWFVGKRRNPIRHIDEKSKVGRMKGLKTVCIQRGFSRSLIRLEEATEKPETNLLFLRCLPKCEPPRTRRTKPERGGRGPILPLCGHSKIEW